MSTKKRYCILTAGMVIQFCAGIIYGWSVFRDAVTIHLNWNSEAAKLTSSIMLATFVLGIILGGRAQDKLGPRNVTLAGSILIGLGMAATALVPTGAPWLVYITYGIIAGLGVGTVYMATIAAVQKWFPDRRGFASGMIVCAFGFSLVGFMPLAQAMLPVINMELRSIVEPNLGVPATFLIFGLSFLVICVFSSFFVKNPPQDYRPAGYTPPPQAASTKRQYSPLEMLKTKQFYLLAGGLLFTLPAYFILNPSFKQMAIERGLQDNIALLLVMLTGIASATGRLVVSWVSDQIGRKGAMVSIAAITLVAALAMIWAQGILFLVCILLVSFSFGGAASVYSAMTADSFGTKFGGMNFGLVMIGFGVSALVFQLISTALSETASFVVAASTCAAAIIIVLLMKNPKYSTT